MSGNLWMFSDMLDDEDIEMLKRDFITYYQGADDPYWRNHWNFPDTEERIKRYRPPTALPLVRFTIYYSRKQAVIT